MDIIICRAKLNKATVSSCKRDYSGSIAVDKRVLMKLHVRPYEKILVVNRDKGTRFETYVVPAEKGVIELQGGAALLGDVGDVIGFLVFGIIDEVKADSYKPKIVELAPNGEVIEIKAKEFNL